MPSLKEYLEEDLILFFDASSRDQALDILIDQLEKKKKLQDREKFKSAILDREKIVSTGIGMGVAIPHAKMPEYEDFFLAVGILKDGIDWNSLDGAPVRLIFLIGGPDDKQTEYLQILSQLTLAIKDETRRKKLLTLKSRAAMMSIFRTSRMSDGPEN